MVIFDTVTEKPTVAYAYQKYSPEADADVPLPPRTSSRGARVIEDSAADGGVAGPASPASFPVSTVPVLPSSPVDQDPETMITTEPVAPNVMLVVVPVLPSGAV